MKRESAHIINCLVRLVLTQRLPFLNMGPFLHVPLNDLNLGDAWTSKISTQLRGNNSQP